MSYKELKDETKTEEPKTSNGVAYAEIIGALMMTAMLCGTILMTTGMWIQERQDEIGYLRGSSP